MTSEHIPFTSLRDHLEQKLGADIGERQFGDACRRSRSPIRVRVTPSGWGACSVYCCRLVHVVVRGRHLCTVWRKLKSGDVKI